VTAPELRARLRPVLIAGPTASGKSALALRLAERSGGWVINADALQVYGAFRALTARPTPEQEARAPHLLYGFLDACAPWSVGDWLRAVAGVLEDCRAHGLRPILVGGTGLYFKALTEGLAEIPVPAPDVRAGAEALLAREGRERLAARLAARDPATAAQTDLANPARLLRAWEVLEATGRGLAAWRAGTPPPLLPLSSCDAAVLAPDRALLYARIDARVAQMACEGALEEARAALALPPSAPALKAVGAAEFMACARGEATLAEAAAAAAQATRNYAKRQLTWGRNQMIAWKRLDTQESVEKWLSATETLAQGA
jgi:tRNA dimethylallyltransferase